MSLRCSCKEFLTTYLVNVTAIRYILVIIHFPFHFKELHQIMRKFDKFEALDFWLKDCLIETILQFYINVNILSFI